MQEILMSGYRMKIPWRGDILILTGRMPDSFEIDGGIRDEKQP